MSYYQRLFETVLPVLVIQNGGNQEEDDVVRLDKDKPYKPFNNEKVLYV
jgi:hypothetical protein